ncbi:MAG: hypothetical protein E7397_08525 [Ruminococcaceae bacterium]|nr:hypothetical protein [Oscillospiraceae bacterium]
MKKINKWVPVLAGLAVAGIYRAVKGKGAFNPIRFASQRDAVERYVASHYPGAVYSDITELPDGWSCIVTHERRQIMLFITRTEDGTYIFRERAV